MRSYTREGGFEAMIYAGTRPHRREKGCEAMIFILNQNPISFNF